MNDIITVKDLRLWYGQTQALKGVSMDIPEKSISLVFLRKKKTPMTA